MARLGVVIGVSENLPPLISLTACQNDGAAMAAVLKETGRFDDILTLIGSTDTASINVKSRLTNFIEKYKNSAVEELVFYFSGHGDFAGDEFYHILSDYQPGARNRTSLANSELDGMMRGLAPALFVKIVDACHSGTSYIKNGEGLNDYLKAAGSGFKDVYFLYSSQTNEMSWTAGRLSAFTTSILTAIGRQNSGSIRYRDIMSAVSDDFEASGNQTPQFVTQADFTQTFCEASAAMQALVNSHLPKPIAAPAPAPAPVPSGKNTSLVARIKQTEENFCTREQAAAAVERLRESFAKAVLPDELAEIFKWQETTSEELVGDAVAVGEWLSKHADRSFFAIPTYRTETYKRRVPKDPFSFRTLTWRLTDEETKLVDTTRQVVSGYKKTTTMPSFEKIILRLEPKFKSVTPQECYVLPLVSTTDMRLFWAFRQFHRSDWDTVVPVSGNLQWDTAETPLKDEVSIESLARQITSDFTAVAEKALASRWAEPAAERLHDSNAVATKPGERRAPQQP